MTAHTSPASAARPGRRPGTSTTRQAILTAARARFAADGFTGTTIRRVAGDAGVDASLVMQFFRSKNELFAAVMAVPADALTHFSDAFEGTDDGLGERVVRAFLDVWEGDARTSEPLMAMLRGAIVNEQANEQLREFIQERFFAAAVSSRNADAGEGADADADADADAVDGDAMLRAGIVSSMLVGLVVGRGVVGVHTLAEAEREKLIMLVGPAVQSVLVPTP
ncbi:MULTISPECIES: TetR/AcrR family transcriptional regulator [unclassified Streptomyces]|uniref:TetR/AcrR family transcriptional regulator n=1 Tax=unclassified Streptomyces TaxID=2593676 RepID=UPI002DDB3D54|nr:MULTISPECIES: TetR family transcriptional regulator [unclassified Streptomyces]WRZ67892.1 TetR/AcrR family transcriptional regulator [Streptomyces sp. NBC_01257]WSJ25784.1 TetR/AcrR family transcriptional regulator [Streptomyces sp. NBC_01324]